MPSTNKKAQYIRYIVRDLSFTQSVVDDKKNSENFTIKLGYSSPIIDPSHNDEKNVVAMPFKFDLRAEGAFQLKCTLDIGFKLMDDINTTEDFKNIVNNDPEYFTKYIENAINKIISSTLSNTAFNIDDVFDIPKFSYQD